MGIKCEVWGKGGVLRILLCAVLWGLVLCWEVSCGSDCIWDFGVGLGRCFAYCVGGLRNGVKAVRSGVSTCLL